MPKYRHHSVSGVIYFRFDSIDGSRHSRHSRLERDAAPWRAAEATARQAVKHRTYEPAVPCDAAKHGSGPLQAAGLRA
jgi:hypothetical protein